MEKFALDVGKVLEASCLVVKFAPFHREMKLRRRCQATNTPVITAGRTEGGLRPFCACMEERAWKIVALLAMVFYYQLLLCILRLIISEPLIDLLRKSMFLTLTNYRALWRCCVSNLRSACV